MQKITRNSFEKGVNKDIDSDKIQPSSYTDAHNVELVGDGDFFSLRNIKGTTFEHQILESGGQVIGVYDNVYKIGGVSKKCLTVFTFEDALALNAEPATFQLTGSSANLNYSAAITMPASAGGFTMTGQAADLKTYRLTASNGNFNLFGSAATLTAVTLINIELVVSTAYGSRFNVEFSGVNETKTINRTNTGTTTSTIKSSSSIAAKVTKGASGTETAADNGFIEWFKTGTSQNVDNFTTGVVINNTYTYTSVVQGDTLRVEVTEG